MRRKLTTAAAVLSLLFALGVVLYYIWSGYYVEELQSDRAEIVFWAQACLEGKSLINPDFTAAYFIPFGGQLVFIPIVARFGVGINSLRLGMTINGLIFLAALFGFLKTLFKRTDLALFLTAGMTLCLSASVKLREIFWGHVIYYSLAPFFLMAVLILLERYWQGSAKRRILPALCLCFFLGCADGTTMLVFFAGPLLLAVCLELLLRAPLRELRTKENRRLLIAAVLGSAAGSVFNKLVSKGLETGYADQFTVFLPESEWLNNLIFIPRNWFSLFTRLPESEVPYIGAEGIMLFISLVFALVLPLVSLIALKLYPRFSRTERVFCLVHWIISLIILFCYGFGNLYFYNHRMIPMYWSGLILLLICVRTLLSLKSDVLPNFPRVAAFTASVLFSAFALSCGIRILTHPIDTGQWYGYGSLPDKLAEQRLTDGYTLDFWNGNALTLVTNEQVRSRLIRIDPESGMPVPDSYQSDIHWYDPQPEQERFFLICSEKDYFEYPQLQETADQTFRLTQHIAHTGKEVGLVILVYDKDPLKRE